MLTYRLSLSPDKVRSHCYMFVASVHKCYENINVMKIKWYGNKDDAQVHDIINLPTS
jgi:hypothetical protein